MEKKKKNEWDCIQSKNDMVKIVETNHKMISFVVVYVCACAFVCAPLQIQFQLVR